MDTKIAPYTFYAEMTPNPNTMKFVSNRWLVPNDKSFEILADQRVGSPSPLAERLFNFPFINGVFLAANFITITKSDAVEWNEVVTELREFLKEYLNSAGAVIIKDEFLKEDSLERTIEENSIDTETTENYTDFDKKIIEILDEYIRPAVESDGGAIVFHSYSEGIVKVILKGSCSGCPSSTMTLKAGIESLLKNMLPEVKEVVAINA